MRLLVVGAGATGGYFGGRLAQHGRDVTFLVRPARAEALRRDGLRITSPHGDVTLAPTLVQPGAIAGPYDAVLLTVKGYQLDAALEDIAPAVGERTMVLPVLNGMRHMDLLAQRFGPGSVAGCACKVATTLDGEGRIVQLAPFQSLVYGERDGSVTPRMQALDAMMQGAGFDAQLSPDVTREMWEKWVLLAAMGGITCLGRGTLGEVEAAPGGAAFIAAFLGEVAAVVTAEGHPPDEDFLARTLASLSQKGSRQASSMYRDLVAGRPVEVDQILGDLLARGVRAGLATPLLAAAVTHLGVYQSRLAGR